MGVKGLDSIIKAYAEACITKREFKDYNGTTQSVDASVNLYKFCIAIMNTENFKSKEGIIIGHLFAGLYKSLSMLKYGIMPLWTFDGKPPSIKNGTLGERKKIRENAAVKLTALEGLENSETERIKLEKRKFAITPQHIKETKYLLTLMGLPLIESPGEAEAQCAACEISGISHGCVTEDWDAILFGCKKMLKDFSNKAYVTEIDAIELMKLFEMTREQLINLGAILGNDYCSGIGGLKPLDAFVKFKECNFNVYKLINVLNKENICEGKLKYKIPKDFIDQIKKSYDYYLNAPVADPTKIKLTWNKPDYNKLYNYLVKEKKFDEANIQKKIFELEAIYYRHLASGGKIITMSRIRKEFQFTTEQSEYINNFMGMRHYDVNMFESMIKN